MQFRAPPPLQVSAVRPAHRPASSDRECPLDTARDRCLWHVGGTAGTNDDAQAWRATAPARPKGEAVLGNHRLAGKSPEGSRQRMGVEFHTSRTRRRLSALARPQGATQSGLRFQSSLTMSGVKSVPFARMMYRPLAGATSMVASEPGGSKPNRMYRPSGDQVGVIANRPCGSRKTLVWPDPSGRIFQMTPELVNTIHRPSRDSLPPALPTISTGVSGGVT